MELLDEAEELLEVTRSFRRDFHRHPELGFQEVRTAGIVARELTALGLEVTTGLAKTGVIAMLEGSDVDPSAPTVMLRFDMDALPIQEETGAEYASQNPGVMHACGHDGHTAIGIAVARLLHKHRAGMRGRVKLLFQPAEEALGGAEAMLAAGALENPRPQACLALHLWNEKPAGWIGAADGPVLAAGDIFTVSIAGKGGHGALPQLAVDPILAAAQMVTALQSIPARNVSPLDTAVISVTAINGGSTFNVIPSGVELRGTIRTFDASVRDVVLRRFREIVEGVPKAFGCQSEIRLKSLAPAVVNQPDITALVRQEAHSLLPGAEVSAHYQSMVSEDMAFFMNEIPGCFVLVGSANPEKGLAAPHHHPKFDIDETVLPQAAALMAAAALRLLQAASLQSR